jgi:hypothetical protein
VRSRPALEAAQVFFTASEPPRGLCPSLVEARVLAGVAQLAQAFEELRTRLQPLDAVGQPMLRVPVQGPRTFQTARDHWPRDLPGGGLLLRDVAGDLYMIADLAALDAASRAALWAFVDLP